MKQYLIEFEHDSKHLGYDGRGQLLVSANTFEEACNKIADFSIAKVNKSHKPSPYHWNEYFDNARNFVNLTIE